MRLFEIILKFLFALISIYLLVASKVVGSDVTVLALFVTVPYLLISLLLGLVLVFNKKSSYNYSHSKKDYLIRRIEGTLLIIFAIVSLSFLINL
jgi:hypothetical protein